MSKAFYTMLLFLLSFNYILADGTIKGKLLDKSNNSPIQAATITVYEDTLEKVLTGTVSNNLGEFEISGIKNNVYKLKITFIGYDEKQIFPVKITSTNQNIDLGNIFLEQKSVDMTGVQITGQKSNIEFHADKMVVNVDNTLPSAGGTVLDVLKNTPSVNVDSDNNISLRGNTSINIMIDGRPSGGITNKLLEQMPASSVEKIELITNPSAKYDAEGTAGIINIILKKQKEANFNGLVSATGGTQDNYNSSINLNYKENDFNFYFNYDNRYNHRSGEGWSNRNFLITGPLSSYYQKMNFDFNGFSHNVKTGLDYNLNEFNTISASLLYNKGKGERDMNNNTLNYSSPGVLANSYANFNEGSNEGEVIDASLGYKKLFEQKGEELTADLYFSTSINDDKQFRNTTYSNMSQIDRQNTFTDNHNVVSFFKTDYVTTFSETAKLEAGFKSNYKKRFINYNTLVYDYPLQNWLTDNNQSYDFNYEEFINAAYSMYSNSIDKFRYQLGLRAEQTNTNSKEGNSLQEYNTDYIDFFPTVHFIQEISQGQEIKLSYSRRINRPNMYFINPFPRVMDPKNIFVGNPYLKPEYINSFELGHSIFAGSTSLFTTFFYRQVNNVITPIIELVSDSISRQTFMNLSKQTSYGVELNGGLQLLSWWNLNGGYSYYWSEYDGTYPGSNMQATFNQWYARLSSTINLPFEIDWQFNMYYSSPTYLAQGRMKSILYTDMGFKKVLLDGKLTVNLRVSDVFKNMKYISEINARDFAIYAENKMKGQVISLTLSYNINNYKRAPQRRNEEDNGGKEYEKMNN